MKSRRVVSIVCVIFAMFMFAGYAHAESYVAFSLGYAMPRDFDASVSAPGYPTATGEIEMDNSFLVGANFGHWFDQHPWLGLAFDFSYLQPDPEEGELDLFPLSALIMARHKSDNSKLTPYIAAGPSLAFSRVELAWGYGLPDYSDTDISLGFDLRTGLSFALTPKVSLRTEFGTLYFSPNYEDDIGGIEVSVEGDTWIHSVRVGCAIAF